MRTINAEFNFIGNPSELKEIFKKLPRGNLSYYNSNSVDLFQEACRLAKFHAYKKPLPSVDGLLGAAHVLSLDLDRFKHRLNQTDQHYTIDLDQNIRVYEATLEAFFANYQEHKNSYVSTVVNATNEKLKSALNKFKQSLLVGPAPDLLLSAQDRDSKVYSLGRFLNNQTALLCEMLDKIVRVPEFGNTAVLDQFSLSEVPKAFADAARQIRRQNSWAYKQFVNTRAPVTQLELEFIQQINLKSFDPNMSVAKAAEMYHYCLDTPLKRKKFWSNLPQISIHSYFESLESLSHENGLDNLANRLMYAGLILSSPILLLPFCVELIGFGLVFGLTAVAYSIDVARLCVQLIMLCSIIPLIISIFDPKIAESIMTFGGLFAKSLLFCVQDILREHALSEIDLDEVEINKLRVAANKPDNLVFLNNPDMILRLLAQLPLLFNWILTKSTDDPMINLDSVVKDILSDPRSPKPIILSNPKPQEPLRVGRSPVKAVNEIFLGLSDDLIGVFRQNHPLPSTLGYAISFMTLGFHLLPASVIAQMHAKSLVAALQISADWFAKSFMGHGHLVADPANEFFAVLLQWKGICVIPEFMVNLTDESRGMLVNTIEFFEWYFTSLLVGMGSGYALGMLPIIQSEFAILINLLIEEAKIAQSGIVPFTAIEYSFIMGKLAFLFYTLVEHSSLNMASVIVPASSADPNIDYLTALSSESLDIHINKLSLNDRKIIYTLLLNKFPEPKYLNLTDAFFNRYVRADYPALFRLPVGCCYIVFAPLRELYRFIVLSIYPQDRALQTSIRMERAVDRVLFDDWFGVFGRIGFQFVQMCLQTIVMLFVLPLVVVYGVLGVLPWLAGGYKEYNPIQFGQLIEFYLTFWHPENWSYASTAQAAHIGCNYSDVAAIAKNLAENNDRNPVTDVVNQMLETVEIRLTSGI